MLGEELLAVQPLELTVVVERDFFTRRDFLEHLRAKNLGGRRELFIDIFAGVSPIIKPPASKRCAQTKNVVSG